MSGPTKLQRARYYGSVSLIYLLTLLFAVYCFDRRALLGRPAAPAGPLTAAALSLPKQLTAASPVIISGTPVKISIPSLGINVPIQPGYYNTAANTWTLSDSQAQYAVVTAPANNYSGSTFIYGHRLPNIFGPLHLISAGVEALVYTSNGHIFKYTYLKDWLVQPSDTSTLNYRGPPILTVQTCGGTWDDQRHMFVFKFDEVVK